MTDGPWLVVGLGNPGPQYATTRHNAGRMVVDLLAARAGTALSARHGLLHRRPQAATAEVRLGVLPGGVPGPRVVLAGPTTYMNVSGGPVAGLARYHHVEPGRLVVVHDELDLPYGTLRLKRGGGDGGHNGLKDVSRALGTRDYLRVRVGIGRPPGRMDPADFVLKDFSAAERSELGVLLEEAADAVTDVVVSGLEAAQGVWHSKG